MSFKSFLSAVGHDFLGVFNYLGSDKGKAAVAGVEGVVNTVASVENPALGKALVGVEALINAGINHVLSMEASAAAVGAQSGTGPQKGAAVAAVLAPQVAEFLRTIGISEPTAEQSQTVATALSSGIVAVLNSIPAPAAK